jgi:hypothetical protein
VNYFKSSRGVLATAALMAISCCPPVVAATSRLLATGGVAQIEGSAGGGLTPWALIAGLGSDRELGASAFCTRVSPQDFRLDSCGVAVGGWDRVEISYARQQFDLGTTVPGESIAVDVFGAKLRLFGDAVYDQDRWLPQIAVGVQYKDNRDFAFVPSLLGAKRGQDADWYIAATKLWLDGAFSRFTLVNVTLRYTRANQLGILGFGGDRGGDRSLNVEASAALFVTDNIALGAEYRQKPDLLSAFREDDFHDLFAVWFPLKRLSVTAAWVDLGNVADKRGQRGLYLSLQGSL